MKIIPPSFTIEGKVDGEEILKHIERAGRTCYKSEDLITLDSAKNFVASIIKRGHESVLEHASISVRIICDRGCCYDEDTKVLTRDGWKYFNETNMNDEFYTLNDNNEIEYIKPLKKISYKYNGPMDLYSSTQLNLCVTPNHNMWVFDYDKRKNRNWKFLKSSKLTNGRYKFAKTAKRIKNINSIRNQIIPGCLVPRGFYSKDFPQLSFNKCLLFEFLGWWITDGSISYGKNGSGNRLVISQTKKVGKKRIRYILKILGISFTEYKKEFRVKSPQLLRWIASNFLIKGNTRKTYYAFIPKWVFKLESKVLLSFLNGIIGGDGTKHTNSIGYQIYTASNQFAHDIVELALLIGMSANIYKTGKRTRKFPNGHISKCKEQFVVSIVKTKDILFDRRSAIKETIQYNGMIYCVEIPKYHRLYVMRQGKPIWCGNSHEIVRHRIASYSQESTRYCNYGKEKFGNEITVIVPSMFLNDNSTGQNQYNKWRDAMQFAENAYMYLLSIGASAQAARSILPNSLKTELVMTTNLREWRHFFKLRTTKAAHPQMREIACPMLDKFKKLIPIVFDDIEVIK